MRHVRSILYALILAPALWILTGVGFNHDLTTRGRGTFAVESFAGLLLLLLAGAAYGILAFAPISPAGPLLAGVTFLGIACWALAAPAGYAGTFPTSLTKDSFDLSRPGYGLAALLAVPLICTALSARRWEKYEPPVLPIIGVVGRPRGKAAAPGTTIAALATQVIPPPATDATTVLRLPDSPNATTTVLPRQRTAVPREQPADVTMLLNHSDDATSLLAVRRCDFAAQSVRRCDFAAQSVRRCDFAAQSVRRCNEAAQRAGRRATRLLSVSDETTALPQTARNGAGAPERK